MLFLFGIAHTAVYNRGSETIEALTLTPNLILSITFAGERIALQSLFCRASDARDSQNSNGNSQIWTSLSVKT